MWQEFNILTSADIGHNFKIWDLSNFDGGEKPVALKFETREKHTTIK